MLRSEIRMVDLDPARGSEADKRRPAVVVSNDGMNATATRLGRGVVTVVPLTSNTRHVYPFQVLLGAEACGLPISSKAQAEQVRSVDVARVGILVGQVPHLLMAKIESALVLHLGLDG
jgi:mRNA interferase MazF